VSSVFLDLKPLEPICLSTGSALRVELPSLDKNRTDTAVAGRYVGGLPERLQISPVILGEVSAHKDLVRMANKLGVADKGEFPVKVELEEVPNYLFAAVVYCFASITETQDPATMEAMAAGPPVAAVDSSGSRDAFEDGNRIF